MKEQPMGEEMKCEEFWEELERLPLEMPGSRTAEEWRANLPEIARTHAASCAECGAALEDFAETRGALGTVRERQPEPGPWFVARVMATIRAEAEEQKNGVWVGVMKLAPKLAALAMLLLVLGGTWALQLRRAADQRNPKGQVEGIFEAAPSTAYNDDIVALGYEEQR
jgi:hypothetical protein